MHRRIGDFIVALVAALAASVVVSYLTKLHVLALTGVFIAALIVYGLIRFSFKIPSIVLRRRKALRTEIIMAVTEAVLAQLDIHTRALKDESYKTQLVMGRMLQASLRDWINIPYGIPTVLSMRIARWEAEAAHMLRDKPNRLTEFRSMLSTNGPHVLPADEIFQRMDYQLQVIEEAVQHQ
jgi:hypothetical protein